MPLWGETGFDAPRGSFVERLTFEGSPVLSAPRRAMVQARQIYVFSHAALLGWRPEGKATALEAAHRLIDRYQGVDGGHGWIFSVHPDGGSTTRSAIFTLIPSLCSASPGRISSRPSHGFSRRHRHVERARSALRVAERGYHRVLPGDASQREQNPHMHLFEAMLAWFEATGREMFLARAAELYGMMAARFSSIGPEFWLNILTVPEIRGKGLTDAYASLAIISSGRGFFAAMPRCRDAEIRRSPRR